LKLKEKKELKELMELKELKTIVLQWISTQRQRLFEGESFVFNSFNSFNS